MQNPLTVKQVDVENMAHHQSGYYRDVALYSQNFC